MLPFLCFFGAEPFLCCVLVPSPAGLGCHPAFLAEQMCPRLATRNSYSLRLAVLVFIDHFFFFFFLQWVSCSAVVSFH